MAKKSSADDNLLNALSQATKNVPKGDNSTQEPAGKKITQSVVKKEKEKANIPYNIRLSQSDSEIIEEMILTLRKKGRRRASSADVVRVALRCLSKEAKSNPLKYL